MRKLLSSSEGRAVAIAEATLEGLLDGFLGGLGVAELGWVVVIVLLAVGVDLVGVGVVEELITQPLLILHLRNRETLLPRLPFPLQRLLHHI